VASFLLEVLNTQSVVINCDFGSLRSFCIVSVHEKLHAVLVSCVIKGSIFILRVKLLNKISF